VYRAFLQADLGRYKLHICIIDYMEGRDLLKMENSRKQHVHHKEHTTFEQ
jgi:hypothetical protein